MTIVFAILLFSLLIFVHELGHFVAAKLSGVRVNEFAMFMGPAILKWGKGETQYSIRSIPIGGYCAMEGENEDTDDPRSFQKAAWWKRLIILVAGSFMNFAAGLIIFAVVFGTVKEPLLVPVIESAEVGCTIVRKDGLQVGDEIWKLDGERIYVHSDFTTLLEINPGQTHDVVVRRNGEKIKFENYSMEKHLFPGQERELFGINFGSVEPTIANKAKFAWNSTMNVARSVRLSLKMMVSGQAGLKDMSGPVGIVQIMNDSAQAAENKMDAFLNVLYIGGFLAVNLAVMNLLPIPALDGGRVVGLLLTCAIEGITRKKLDPKYEGYIHGVGMVLLLALMGIILFKDIFVIFKR